MKLNYRKGGQTHSIELSPDKPAGKSLAVRHNGTNYYAALVATDDANASGLRINIDGETFAVAQTTYSMLTYNDDKTAVTLNSSDIMFEGDLLATDYASTVVTITAAEGANNGEPIFIQGNANDNVIRANSNGGTLEGNGGNNLFFVGNGNATVTDFNASTDRVSLANSYVDIIDFATDDGLKIFFGSGNSVSLSGADTSDTVTVNSTGYTFNASTNKVFTADGRGVTLVTTPDDVIDVATDPLYSRTATVIANAGGTIKAYRLGLTSGGRNVSLVGGNGEDNYVYSGGNITISGYSGNYDHIRLTGDYSISAIDTAISGGVALQMNDGHQIFLEGLTEGDSVKLYWANDTEHLLVFSELALLHNFSAPANPQNSIKVTLRGSYGDFGVQGDSLDSGYPNGAAFYKDLHSIIASQENSTIVGNQLGNTMYVVGGDRNVLTGGIGKEYFIFQGDSGGVVTDFGIGSTKNTDGIFRASIVTATGNDTLEAYDRDNPASYAAGIDSLQVYGTVTAVAIDEPNRTDNELMTAYVTYTGSDGQNHYIALANICKKPLTATPYQ